MFPIFRLVLTACAGWKVVNTEQQQADINTLFKELNAEVRRLLIVVSCAESNRKLSRRQATVEGTLKNLHAVSVATKAASEHIAHHLLAGRFTLNLGGDHSLAIGYAILN
jgi:hypothetical protein